MDDDSRLKDWEQRTDMPLGIASLVFLGSYAVHVLEPDLPEAVHVLLLSLTYLTWAMFAVDYAVRWRLSGAGPGFVRRHWLDTVVLVLPLLRPVRVVRTYEAMQRRHGEPRMGLHARVAAYSALSISLLGFSGALAVYQAERSAPNATIRTFGDSLWWTCSTLSTVGYGDYVPVTTLGRFIAVGLMACGLALLGTVTGSFSSWMLQRFDLGEDENKRPPRK
ncbi:potassium channel family protein [Streptomyces arenae]|uniref:potassium channel family protein n=1 Tax=Streptomyces arenae TaxID=29301 RepID=UPI0026587E72|nr:potassium channel family protein [Streptomyces arenae]MCG7207882.1 potassium channel family protein [Streptomyces arenae]